MKIKYLSPAFFQRSVWIPLRVVFTVFCSLEIKGIDHVKQVRGNIIIASNHLSELDPLLIVACLPFFSRHIPVIYVSNQKYSYLHSKWKQIIYGGIFFKMIGAYPVYRGLNNYGLSLKNHINVIQQGKNVCIFPHGRRVHASEIAKAKGGVSYLAAHTNSPIIPLRIEGVDSLTIKSVFFGKRKVSFTFGKPLYAKDIFPQRRKIQKNDHSVYEAAAARLMQRIEQLA